jgi:protein-S-isoprenylcysteine O-methyltransferase Ste14
MDFVWLALAWVFYYFLHSWLALEAVKTALQPIFGGFYRFFYTIFATVTLLAVLYLHSRVASQILFDVLVLQIVGLGVALLGSCIGLRALLRYDLWEFVGIRPSQNSIPGKDETPVLITTGLQGRVRHPLYLGILLAVWGYWLVRPSIANLIFAGVTTLYIPIGVYLEEKKLLRQFGEAYARYRAQVPMLFPRLK